MSDARWAEVFADMSDAVTHFRNGVRLYEAGGFTGEDLDAYRARMAFMHAIQAGHTSLESGLLRILDILAEEPPTGDQWHRDLVLRPPGKHLDQMPVHRFFRRNWRCTPMRHAGSAISQCEAMGVSIRPRPTVVAAGVLAEGLSGAISRFRDIVDPAA